MGRAQQFLVPGKGGLSYVDTFAAVSPRWTLRAGTLAAGLQAATSGDWLFNLVSNGESWTGGPPPTGWAETNVALVSADSTVDPGVSSVTAGAANATVGKVTKTAADNSSRISNILSVISGRYYALRALIYTPSANTGVNIAYIRLRGIFDPAINSDVSVDDSWVSREVISRATVTGAVADDWFVASGLTVGDIAYFDKIEFYRQNTVATLSGWGSPNITATLDLPQPAVPSAVPFSFITRYVDALNYWEVRVDPNTAGNDCQIIELVAGVPTVRAAADIDWTASQTDQVRVTVRGASIAVEAKKFGAGAFSAACSYATMATGLTATNHGMMFYGTGVNRCTRWESHT